MQKRSKEFGMVKQDKPICENRGFRNDFEAMVSVLTKYSSNLNIIAERYESRENAKTIAGRLSVGK